MSESAIKISIRLATGGKPIVRRFKMSDSVRSLFAFVASMMDDGEQDRRKRFDVMTAFPTKSLSEVMESSLEENGLANSQVIVRWL